MERATTRDRQRNGEHRERLLSRCELVMSRGTAMRRKWLFWLRPVCWRADINGNGHAERDIRIYKHENLRAIEESAGMRNWSPWTATRMSEKGWETHMITRTWLLRAGICKWEGEEKQRTSGRLGTKCTRTAMRRVELGCNLNNVKTTAEPREREKK